MSRSVEWRTETNPAAGPVYGHKVAPALRRAQGNALQVLTDLRAALKEAETEELRDALRGLIKEAEWLYDAIDRANNA